MGIIWYVWEVYSRVSAKDRSQDKVRGDNGHEEQRDNPAEIMLQHRHKSPSFLTSCANAMDTGATKQASKSILAQMQANSVFGRRARSRE